MTFVHQLTPKQLRPYHPLSPQCSRKVEEMGDEASQAETQYRLAKSEKTGLDPGCCFQRAKYEIRGLPLCAFHARIEALDILMEDSDGRCKMILHCYIDEETEETLREEDAKRGRTMEDLAESVVSETCLTVRLEQSKASALRSPKLL